MARQRLSAFGGNGRSDRPYSCGTIVAQDAYRYGSAPLLAPTRAILSGSDPSTTGATIPAKTLAVRGGMERRRVGYVERNIQMERPYARVVELRSNTTKRS